MEKLPQAIKIRSFVVNVPKKTLCTSNFRIYLILSPCYFRNSMQHVGKQPATETDCREYVFHTTPTPFYMYLPIPAPFCIYLPTPTPFCMYLLTPDTILFTSTNPGTILHISIYAIFPKPSCCIYYLPNHNLQGLVYDCF